MFKSWSANVIVLCYAVKSLISSNQRAKPTISSHWFELGQRHGFHHGSCGRAWSASILPGNSDHLGHSKGHYWTWWSASLNEPGSCRVAHHVFNRGPCNEYGMWMFSRAQLILSCLSILIPGRILCNPLYSMRKSHSWIYASQVIFNFEPEWENTDHSRLQINLADKRINWVQGKVDACRGFPCFISAYSSFSPTKCMNVVLSRAMGSFP